MDRGTASWAGGTASRGSGSLPWGEYMRGRGITPGGGGALPWWIHEGVGVMPDGVDRAVAHMTWRR